MGQQRNVTSFRFSTVVVVAAIALLTSGCSLFSWGMNNSGQLGNGTTSSASSPGVVGQEEFDSISVGGSLRCGIKADDTLWCAGRDYQVGWSPPGDSVLMRQYGTASNWQQVSAGAYSPGHFCAVNTPGELWCDGSGFSIANGLPGGQIGTDSDWAHTEAGSVHSCAIKTAGTLWCWGWNDDGQLGDGTTTDRDVPTQVGSETDWVSVAPGSGFTCGVRANGTMWCWGRNDVGQLGDGTTFDRSTPGQVGTVSTWSEVAVGTQFACALQDDGSLWCWGANSSGQLGVASQDDLLVPTLNFHATAQWQSLDLGALHACATRTDGSLWCWGRNVEDQLGVGITTSLISIPFQIGTFNDWESPSLSGVKSCALRDGGHLWCWGSGLGVAGEPLGYDVPTPMLPQDWTDLGAGGSHSCGVRQTSALYCWGANSYGQLGFGSTTSSTRPLPVTVPSRTGWSKVESGTSHSCALQSLSGTLWCWGRNNKGQLGQGNTTSSTVPIRVGSAVDWKAISLAVEHTCGVRNPGTLWCWGENNSGRLGDGTTTDRLTPTQVGTNSDWATVSTYGSHSCATKTNGTLWCWGWNAYGQIGDGTTTTRLSPVQVGSNTDWKLVAAGSFQTCATRATGSAGTLWCWGDNTYGQLGDGTTSDHNTPEQVGTETNWLDLTGGAFFGCARQTGNILVPSGLWCWGQNAFGQLGDGTTVQRNAPVPVGIGTNWVVISAGATHMLGADY